jgi:signal transduction histidine kinase
MIQMRLARRALAFSAVFAAWTLVGLLALGQPILARLFRYGPSVPRGLVIYNLESVWLWALFTPAIFRLAAAFPITVGRLRNTIVHLGLASGFCLLDVLVDRSLLPLFGLHYQERLLVTLTDQLFVNFICYTTVMLAGLALTNARLYHERRLRETQLAAELAAARLRALEMQLRPHFLFNALHSVGALIRANQGREAIRTLAELGDLLRALLGSDDRHETTVQEELDLTLRYLRIEEVRFGDRLEVRLAVAPEALAALVPKLVLQPLVENAIRHGVESSTGPAQLDLHCSVDDSMLWLSVSDHGPGAGSAEGNGIGLANTRARLEQLYGQRFRLEARPLVGGGYQARVGVPFHTAPAAVVEQAS